MEWDLGSNVTDEVLHSLITPLDLGSEFASVGWAWLKYCFSVDMLSCVNARDAQFKVIVPSEPADDPTTRFPSSSQPLVSTGDAMIACIGKGSSF